MSEERHHITPEEAADYAQDVDRDSLSEKSDALKRLETLATLDALEESKKLRKVHVDSLVESIDTTPNQVFTAITHHIHEGDIHFNQEGVTFEPQPEAPKVESSYGQKNRAKTRRRTRNIGNNLLRRHR